MKFSKGEERMSFGEKGSKKDAGKLAAGGLNLIFFLV